MQSITPCSETTREFRDALGRFATGVTVVTTDSEIGPLGITANSFASVSLDPAMVLWSPAKSSRRYQAFASAKHFAIHIIGAEQREICEAFIRDGTAFDGLDWSPNEHQTPLINGCLARFECAHLATHDGGDHGIIVARVDRVSWREGPPLVFSQGAYGDFEGSA
ncbi:Nitrilotriacetate monooxygenase component B [Candidatus Rhodobacter oscarellae]|uniref:Nitrilotriacetate monooxygenase component B n=1 Tax=Candidatus Rhodobacter oscarellae TaxID=1675527 RepID=A0A0J9E1C0_9RHOB|nr:flavin reductase family protein [Candidatus Rhodobacter lobularis]KMW56482.1 Nitrilotriacetate monooxygenase component B [Candidatus Rhodobacter lobularis]